ncbi:MAG: peptidoglycan recognition family protein [Actinomycetes bacterium]
MLGVALATVALAAGGHAAAAERPPIAWNAIPYPAKRKAEMGAYSQRHYGFRRYGLHNPKVIVEHLTESSTFSAAWNTFAPDIADSELHELPGVCAHFIIDQNGKIHQLVPISLMCRHTVGLNWTAIGIEHVGFTPSDVLGRAKVRAASLRLTNWLRCREGIQIKNVIGHNESLRSPYHHERVARLRSQTHDDFPTSSMRKYRAALRKLTC